jgi:CPA2 family monovalent cation:H+ antiporter-2
MFAAVPDAPRTPVLSSVEEADEIADDDQDEGGSRPHAAEEPSTPALVPDTDQTGGSAPDQGTSHQPASEPGR